MTKSIPSAISTGFFTSIGAILAIALAGSLYKLGNLCLGTSKQTCRSCSCLHPDNFDSSTITINTQSDSDFNDVVQASGMISSQKS